MASITIIRSNSVIYDTRVKKIFRSLSKKYHTDIIGWNREASPVSTSEYTHGTLHLFNFQAPIGKLSLFAYMPFFWIWAFFKLINLRPDIVYACDFDTVFPGYLYSKLFGKKLIFDAFDRYAMAFIPPKFKTLYNIIDKSEESFAKRSDILVTTSKQFLDSFKKKPQKCFIILNCPEYQTVTRTGTEDNILNLVYTGPISKNRGLEKIVESIHGLSGIDFVLAGRILDKKFLDEITKLPNIKYKGLLLPQDAIKLEADADVMISLYDLVIPNFNYAMSNKTFEAMMLGIPVITNIALELIDETQCGIKVKYDDLNQIREAVIRLRDDNELRKALGRNGRKAFEDKYNWKTMEQKLFEICESLLI